MMAEREVGVETLKKSVNMGADNYSSSSSRLITLQNRKQFLEESIAQKNLELRELCMQESQLTSIMPTEVPLEPGETYPTMRRKVGTAFEYPQSLISKISNDKESIAALETEIQFQRYILEDASRLVNDSVSLKEKRKNTLICEQAKHSIKDLEERLEFLKIQRYGTQPNNQLKQKKKPRPPFKFDISSLKNNNYGSHNEEINKNYVLHHNYPYHSENRIEPDHYMTHRTQVLHQNVSNYAIDGNIQVNTNYRPDYGMSYTLDRVPTSVHSGVKDRRSHSTSFAPNNYSNSHPNINAYQQQYSHTLPLNSHITSMSHVSPHTSPHAINYQNPIGMSQPNLTYSINPHNIHISPLRTKPVEHDPRKSMPDVHHNGYIQESYVYPPQFIQNVHTPPHNDRIYVTEPDNYSNNSNVYHHPDNEVSSSGLGGYWVKNDNNESIWISTISPHNTPPHWPRDKRFGSLDRRKDKFLHNKHLVENRRSNTVLANAQHENVPVQQPLVRSASNQECKPLIRTQSLGSVGAQTVDISWPNDDNSSCDSDGQSLRNSRRAKPKGWCETSLDGPAEVLTNLQEENIYTPPSRVSYQSPQTPKLLEIPAESNPSPIHPDTNNELFNNNGLMDLPKNCTVVQAGQFKPYREVTKPFEMEDFYKYSTKFREKKAEVKKGNDPDERSQECEMGKDGVIKNKVLSGCESQNDVDAPGMVQKSIYQPLQPMKCQPFGPVK